MTNAVTLVLGDEELLVARAVQASLAAHPDVEVFHTSGGELAPGDLTALLSPSLFAEQRAVVVADLQDADKRLAGELSALAADPQAVLVAVHPGTTKGKALVDALRSAGARVVECPRIRWPEERVRFVVDEVTRLGGAISIEAAAELVTVLGTDLRELASACAQLVADSGGEVDQEVIARYHRGRAEATGFVIAERAVDGDAAGALELLRWGLGVGLSPVLVTSALAGNLRTLAMVAAAGRSASAQSLASRLGLPTWKVRKAQGWARGWHPDAVGDAVQRVAAADLAVKGGGVDPGYELEALLLSVATARSR